MLTIYTAQHCPVYPRTCQLVTYLQAHHPDISLELIDLDDPRNEWPAWIIGTPTYVWQGRVIFLGNPGETELSARLNRNDAHE